MSAESMSEMSLVIREATTRNINITCKSKETGEDFNFNGYTAQTYLTFGAKNRYVTTDINGNIVSYKIPADISRGMTSGVAETRVFKDGDVYEVLHINITVIKAEKPDITPNE